MTRELTTDLAVLERLIDPAGKEILDIGCGGGALVRELAARGATVVGLEISEQQLAAATAHDAGAGARYLVGRGESLPLEDGSIDVAIFMRTLHHVPPMALRTALREARRVLRGGGSVYVAEPLAEGDYFALVSLVEDELEVRDAAQRALARAGDAGLDRVATIEYDVRICVRDLDALRARVVSVDPERGPIFDARRAELAEAFNRLGEAGETPQERCFLQPMRADVLSPLTPIIDAPDRRGARS